MPKSVSRSKVAPITPVSSVSMPQKSEAQRRDDERLKKAAMEKNKKKDWNDEERKKQAQRHR